MKRLRYGKATRRRRGKGSEAGFSLIEGLIAAALLLTVAVSILPLFMRALTSNTRGARSSQLTALVNGELESINQAGLDNPAWQLAGDGNEVIELGTRYWDTGHLADGSNPTRLGDERWVDERSTAAGPVMWVRDLAVRKYSFADVHTTIDVDGETLSTLGDPRLFDTPLGDMNNAHITEFRVHLRENRETFDPDTGERSIPLGSSQRMTVGHFRTF